MLKKVTNIKQTREQGFTLIELLVVIVIIGVLAAIALPIFFNQQKAAFTASNQQALKQVQNAITMAQIKTGKTLFQITYSPCTACAITVDPLTLPQTDYGWTLYYRSLDRISEASGMNIRNLTDAYGRPIIIDENEGEQPDDMCRQDFIAIYEDPYKGRSFTEQHKRIPLSLSQC